MTHSDTPEDYHPGRFHPLELGVYVVRENIVCINFTGLWYHGGTPPMCAKGDPIHWAYRILSKQQDAGRRILTSIWISSTWRFVLYTT